MKRTVALTILGVAVATATTAFGQGGFIFNNYASPYVPIAYDAGVPGVGGNNVGAGEGVQIEVWWAAGTNQPANALVLGDVADLSGFAGYTDGSQQFNPATWDGAIYTVQLRASGNAGGVPVDVGSSRGELVNVAVANVGSTPPGVPQYTYTPGFTVFVPEPSTFALAGLGAAALLIFRRRD